MAEGAKLQDLHQRFQLHKLIEAGILEKQALKQVFPDDKNRARSPKNWIKKQKWPMTKEEFDFMEAETDTSRRSDPS
jgi:hypothetical protein